MLIARLGFVDGQSPAVLPLPVQGGDRRLGFIVGGHLDETKSSAPPGHPVSDNFRALDRSVSRKQLFQIRTRYVVAQIPHIEFLAHHESPIDGRSDLILSLSRSQMKGATV